MAGAAALTLGTMVAVGAPPALAAGPDMKITKSGPATASPGQTVTWTLTLQNAGDTPYASTTVVVDSIPAQIDETSVTTSATRGTASLSDGVVRWNFPADAPVGTPYTATISGTLKAGLANGQMVNTATIEDSGACQSAANCTAQATTLVAPSQGKLTLTKQAPTAKIHPQTTQTYTFTVTNSGSVPLTNVTVTEQNALFASDPINCASTGGPTIASLAVNASATCTMQHTFTDTEFTLGKNRWSVGLPEVNTGRVTGTDPGGAVVTAQSSADSYFDLTTDGGPTITVVSPTGPVKAGDTIQYRATMAYSATSDTPLKWISFRSNRMPTMSQDCTPAIPTQANPGYTTACQGPNTQYTVTEDDIRTNWDTGSIATTVQWFSTTSIWDGQTWGPTATATTPIDKTTPMVDFTGSITPDKTTAVPGDTITYTVVATNSGQLTATNVQVLDAPKGGTPAVIDPARCVWPGSAGTLGPGQKVTCTDTYQVQPADAGTTITTPASVKATNGDVPVGPVPIGSASTTVGSGASLSAAKSNSLGAGAKVIPGQQFSYTITVTNSGGTAASGQNFTDLLPDALEFYPTTQAGWTATGQSVTRTSPFVVPAGGTYDMTLQVRVKAGAAPGTVITNVGAIDGTTPPATCATTPSAPGCAVDPFPPAIDASPVSLTKSNSVTTTPKVVVSGQKFSYTLKARNNSGTTAQSGVTIADQLPAGLTPVAAESPGWTFTGQVATLAAIAIPAGTEVTLPPITVTVSAGTTGTLTNIGAVTSVTPLADCVADPTKPGCALDAQPVTAVDHSGITMSKSNDVTTPGKKVKVGDVFTYTVTATNSKATEAKSVFITDTLPAGLAFDGNQDPAWTITGATATATVDVPGNQATSLKLQVRVMDSATGTLRNVAVMDATDPATCTGSPLPAGCGVDPDPPTVDRSAIKLAKANDAGPTGKVKPGQQFTYTFTATNTGSQAATGVTITDPLPAQVEFYPASQPGWSYDSATRTVTSSPFDLAAVTGSRTLSFSVRVLDTAAAGDEVRNAGAITGTTPPATCLTTPGADGCAVDPNPPTVDDSALTMTKTNSLPGTNPQVKAGDTFSYTITLHNSGLSDATGVSVTDELPAGLEFYPASQGGWASLGTTTATSIQFTVGAQSDVSLTLFVRVKAGASGQLKNVVAIDSMATPDQCQSAPTMPGCAADNNPPRVTDHSQVTVTKKNDVTTTGKKVKAGDTFTYTITATNAGATQATGVTIADTLPPGLVFDGPQATAWAITGNTATATGLSVGPNGGTLELSLRVRVADGASGQLKNVAVMDNLTPPATCLTTPAAPGCAVDPEPPTVDNSNVQITKVSSTGEGARVKRGQEFSYAFTAANTGSGPAQGLRIIDPLPAALEFYPATQADFTYNTTTNVAATAAFDLAVGQTRTFTMTVRVRDTAPAGAVIKNAGAIEGTTPPADCLTNPKLPGCAVDPWDPTVDDSAITVTKTNGLSGTPPHVLVGDEYTYTLVIRNTGTMTADRVSITDQLPAGLEFTSTTQSGWSAISATTRQATSAQLSIPGGQTATLTLSVRVAGGASGQLKNVVAVDGAKTPAECVADSSQPGCAADPNPPLVVDHSKVTIAKSNNVTDPAMKVKRGQSFTYTISATNTDTTAVARDVRIADTLPAGLVFDGTQDPLWSITGTTATASADIAPGGTVTLQLRVRVADTASGTLKNVAVMDEQSPATCLAQPSAPGCAVDPKPPIVDLSDVTVTKSSGLGAGARVKPGEEFSYTFTATNTGPMAATGLTIIDPLPAGLEFYPATQADFTYDAATATATSRQFDLAAASGTATLTLGVRVMASASPGLTIENAGAIAGTTPPATCLTNPALPGCAVDPDKPVVDTSDLTITKTNPLTGTPPKVRPGETFSYSLLVRNRGTTNATSVSVTDQLPAGLSFASASQSGWQPLSGTTATSIAFDVAAGTEVRLTLAVTVADGASGQLRNASAIKGMATPAQCLADPTAPGCGVDPNPPVVDNTDVQLTKSSGLGAGALVKRGQSFTYTLTAANKGSETATGVQVVDLIPAGLDFFPDPQAGWTYDQASRKATSAAFDLAPGASRELKLGVRVRSDAAAGSVLSNVGTVDGRTPVEDCETDPSLPGCAKDPDDPVVDDSNVTITKVNSLSGNPPIVTAGDTFSYRIIAKNSGTMTAQQVAVTDLLPAGLTFSPASQPGWTFTGSSAVSDTFALAGNSERTLVLSVMVAKGATGTVKNVAAVNGKATPADCQADPAKDGCAVDPNPPQITDHSEVTITKVNSLPGPAPKVKPGDAYKYTVTVTNQGTTLAKAVRVSDTLPAGLAFYGTQDPAWAITGTSALWITDLAPGATASKDLWVQVLPGASGTLKNIAVMDDVSPSDCEVNPSAPGCGTDDKPPVVDNTNVSATLTNDVPAGRVAPGETYAYTLTVRNDGTEPATGVRVIDPLPALVSIDAASVPAGWSYDQATRTLTSSPFDLPAGGGTKTLTFPVTVSATAPGESVIDNAAAIAGTTPPATCLSTPAAPGCAKDANPPIVDGSQLQVGKKNSLPAPYEVKVGDTFTYTLTVRNAGDSPKDNVVIRDTLPAGLAFTPASQSGWATLAGGKATSNPLSLAPGATATLTLQVQVQAGASGQLRNASAIDQMATPEECLTEPATPGCGVDGNPPTVVDHSDVSITKESSAAGQKVRNGDTFTYTITVVNSGTTKASGVVISDTLPAGLVFDGPQDPVWTITGPAARAVVDIEAGATATYPLKVRVANAPAGKLVNVSVIDDQNPDECLVPNPPKHCGKDNDPPTVDNSDVVVTKSNSLGTATTVKPGQVFTYTLTATNKGTSTATDQKVSDRLPAGLEFYPASQPGWVIEGRTAVSASFELAAGSSSRMTLQVRVLPSAAAGASIKNVATVEGTTPIDDCETDPSLPGCTIDPRPPVVDKGALRINKVNTRTSSAPLARGESFGYDITVTNTGYLDATGVVVSDRLPAALGFEADQAGWSISGQDAVSAPFDLAQGQSTTLHVAVEALKAPAGLLRNVAGLTAFTLPATLSGGSGAAPVASAAAEAPVTLAQCVSDPAQAGCTFDDVTASGERSGVTVSKSNNVAGKVVKAGDTFTYTITVTNSSAAMSRGIMISDTLPAGLVFDGQQSADWVISGDTAKLAQALDLPAGQSRSFSLRVQVTAGAPSVVKNVAVMDETNPSDCLVNPALPGCGVDPNPPAFNPGTSSLSVKKSAATEDVDKNGQMNAGDLITYSFTVTNSGTKAADAGLQVLDPMLEAAGITIICPASELAAGASMLCKASAPYVITKSDQYAGKVTNAAVAKAGDTGSLPGSVTVTTSGDRECPDCASPEPTLPGTGGDGSGNGGDGSGNGSGNGNGGYSNGSGSGSGSGRGSQLPYTGAEIGTVLAAALLLALLGGAAVAASARRREQD